MGKRIIIQRRGKGGSTYRAPSHKYVTDLRYKSYDRAQKEGVVRGKVRDIIHSPERSAPLLVVEYEDREKGYLPGIEGVKVGDEVSLGAGAEIAMGNILPLADIPDGTPVCNIESQPGDGGSLVRASGAYALVVDHSRGKATVQLPSGKKKTLGEECRATVGLIAGGGRLEKPVLKAGKHHHIYKAKAKYWPIVTKVTMNPVDHPFGGKSHAPGKPKTISRRMPPGRKVGLIAARRTGGK